MKDGVFEAEGQNLLTAIQNGVIEQAKRLLRNAKSDYSVTDEAGMGCLHHAASKGFTDITRQLLTERGVDVNTQDRDGQTPLHKATASGKIDVMVMLIALGGSMSAMDNTSNIPLTLAVKANNMKAIENLLLLGSPTIPVDDNSCADEMTRAHLQELLEKQQKTVDALKYGVIRRSLQHTYRGAVAIEDDSPGTNIAETVNQMDFPVLDISVIHNTMDNPFVLSISRIPEDLSSTLPQISDAERLFGDIIECRSWFLPETAIKIIITVDGNLRMNERLHVKTLDGQIFKGHIEAGPETERNSNVTQVTVTLRMPGSSSPWSSVSTSFALIAVSQKEKFKITNNPTTIKPQAEPNSEIFVPKGAFKTPGVMDIEFTGSSEANEDESDDEEPALMTNMLDIAMDNRQQPNAPISIKLPVMCENLSDIVILGTSDSSSDKKIKWTPLEGTIDSSSKLATFQVSHFSTYVGVSRNKVKKYFDGVSDAASRSFWRQRKVVFFAMVKIPNTRTEPYLVVVECCTRRKKQSRMKYWLSNGFQVKTPGQTVQHVLAENGKVRVRLEGVFDPEIKPTELTFLPNSASYKVFDQIYPKIQQDDPDCLAEGVRQDESVHIEAINPEVVVEPENRSCIKILSKIFRINQISPSLSRNSEDTPFSEYCQVGSISINFKLPAEEPPVSDNQTSSFQTREQ